MCAAGNIAPLLLSPDAAACRVRHYGAKLAKPSGRRKTSHRLYRYLARKCRVCQCPVCHCQGSATCRRTKAASCRVRRLVARDRAAMAKGDLQLQRVCRYAFSAREAVVKLQFLGAVRQVTGSQTFVEADSAAVLVDCGMFQERHYLERNWNPSPLDVRRLDAVLLTHAHLDHCGLLPKLVREGLRCPVYATAASAELVAIVLRDSAHIQAEDAAFKLKRHRRQGRQSKYPIQPLYTLEDVEQTLPLLRGVAYGQETRIGQRLTAVFHDAGHILGSAVIELRAHSDGQPRQLIFSGDVGQWDRPIIRDPEPVGGGDYLVLESTYGNRDHKDPRPPEQLLAEIVSKTVQRGGNVVIPIFAIERAQELIWYLGRLLRNGEIPSVPVFLDSPMAADVLEVFTRHCDLFDEEARQLLAAGRSPLRFPGLVVVRDVEQSKAINYRTEPAVILATAGMCTAGRIKHHLAHNIWRPECTVLFVGYQAQGTLGRQILDGHEQVRIHGRYWPLRAAVAQIHGFSGHADRGGLLRWLEPFQRPPRQTFVNHGEEEESLAFAELLRHSKGLEVVVPQFRQTFTLE